MVNASLDQSALDRQKKQRKKLLVIFAVILVVLGLGLGVGYYLMKQSQDVRQQAKITPATLGGGKKIICSDQALVNGDAAPGAKRVVFDLQITENPAGDYIMDQGAGTHNFSSYTTTYKLCYLPADNYRSYSEAEKAQSLRYVSFILKPYNSFCGGSVSQFPPYYTGESCGEGTKAICCDSGSHNPAGQDVLFDLDKSPCVEGTLTTPFQTNSCYEGGHACGTVQHDLSIHTVKGTAVPDSALTNIQYCNTKDSSGADYAGRFDIYYAVQNTGIACEGPCPSPSVAPSATPTTRPSSSPTPTRRPSSTPTPTGRPSNTPTPTANPSASPTPTATVGPSATPTPTSPPGSTATPIPSATPTKPTSYAPTTAPTTVVYVAPTTAPTTVVYVPPTTTQKGGVVVTEAPQPTLPAELPVTGPEDWPNWIKAGLAFLSVGALLFLAL